MAEYDAIVTPGGGVRENGVLPTWVQRRLDRAIELHKGHAILTLSAGTTHRPPPLDSSGFPVFESIAAAKYLIDRGVRPSSILPETCSYDTIGNAFFSRVIHAEPRELRRLLVITSDFHLARTEAVFNWIYSLKPAPLPFELHFEAVSDPSMDESVLRDRCEREGLRLTQLESVYRRITELRGFHRWLYTEHHAYRSVHDSFQESAVGSLTRESY